MKQNRETLKNRLSEVRSMLNLALPNGDHLNDDELVLLMEKAYEGIESQPNKQFYVVLHDLITTDKIVQGK